MLGDMILLNGFRYPVELVYEVVADVQHYKHFVPWCMDSVVHDSDVQVRCSHPFRFEATLGVGFQVIGERYRSVVDVVPGERVVVSDPHMVRSRQRQVVLTRVWSIGGDAILPDTCHTNGVVPSPAKRVDVFPWTRGRNVLAGLQS